ncbi:spirocyclase AveC family protein [Nocardia brasiliensis]|uniref:spirocyclase AveC family protein n=2 Tax=Nocardia brasiliensis TaxID=37326 RepID=UPI00245802D3|nr:spirocyclase AveC family protein [Nocardia brasiliensis]
MRIGTARRDRPITPARHRPAPAFVWAGIGALFAVAELWVLGRWAADGVHAVPAGGEMSTARATLLWIWQALVSAGLAGSLWYSVRTSRHDGKVSVFAALFVGFLTSAWLDPLTNYRDRTLVFNTRIPNVTSWGPYFPGWNGPAPEYEAQTLLAMNCFFFGLNIWWVYLTYVLLQRVIKNRPGLGAVAQSAAAAGIALALVAVFEPICARLGNYSWNTTTRFALFAGHWYQVPLYEIAAAALIVGAPGAVMIHRARSHNREVYFLRGSDNSLVRLLAGVGFVHLTMLVYFVTIIIAAALGTGAPPADTPDYLRFDSP